MARNLAAQFSKTGGALALVEREIPRPEPNEVRVRVQACGVCHSDLVVKAGIWPGQRYPRVPGHEVAGVIDEVGAQVTEWKKGDRVGVGWHGGHCFVCEPCRRGDFMACVNEQVTGVNRDGGYQQYMLVRHEGVARMPDGLDPVDAAPLLCAGLTTFNALRHSGVQAGDLVAVQGIGGLGHLGIQFAAKAGYRTVAVGRGPQNAELAKKLGAFAYIDSKATDVAAELQKLGGASAVLATAPSAQAIADAMGGLRPNGKLVVVGLPSEPIPVPAVPLATRRQQVLGWPSGTAIDSEDTLGFSAFAGVRPMVEKFPLEKAQEAFARMESGHAQFRVVLAMG